MAMTSREKDLGQMDQHSSPPNVKSDAAPAVGTLGTFAGVFTPSVLTILGIILFLR
jgi:hypothetical protein